MTTVSIDDIVESLEFIASKARVEKAPGDVVASTVRTIEAIRRMEESAARHGFSLEVQRVSLDRLPR